MGQKEVLMRFFVTLLLTVGWSVPSFAQFSVVEAGVTLTRDVDASGVGPVHGLSLDDETADAYFIGDGGDDLFRLSPDGTITQIADDVGRFIGILSDLRVGPDGRLYVGDSFLAAGETDGEILRFERDGTFVDTLRRFSSAQEATLLEWTSTAQETSTRARPATTSIESIRWGT